MTEDNFGKPVVHMRICTNKSERVRTGEALLGTILVNRCM